MPGNDARKGTWNGMSGILCEVTGTVLHGKHIGEGLGFPTANLPFPEGENAPPNGVYVAELETLDTGERFRAVLNQGLHPTFPEGAPTLEVHVLEGCPILYGREVRVRYLHFLRPERTFASGEELAAQVDRDIRAAREWTGGAD